MDWIARIQRLPVGYSEGWYAGRRFRLSKQLFSEGRSLKVLAEELGGKEIISFNAYQSGEQWLLKPCEMPAEKVLDFLVEFQPQAQG